MNKLILLFSIAMSYTACTSDQQNKPETSKFLVTSPAILDTNYVSEYVADIHSVQNVEIRSKIKGHLENIYVDEGAADRKSVV